MAITLTTTDNISYAVPAIAGLGVASCVIRVGINSGIATDGGVFIVTDVSTNNSFGFARVGATSAIYCLVRNSGGTPPSMPYTFDGTMRSVAFSFDGSAAPKVVGYIDGVSQTITSPPSNTVLGSGQTICKIGRNSGHTDIKIAEVAIYNRVITAAEAQMHAAGYSCRHFPRGLIFYAPMIREVHDIVGGLTGAITGTTVSEHPRIYA